MTAGIVVALAAVLLAFAAFSAARYFEDLRSDASRWMYPAATSGVIVGVISLVSDAAGFPPSTRNLLLAAAVVITLWIVRASEVDADFTLGMIVGALAMTIAGAIATFSARSIDEELTTLTIAGAIAGTIVFLAAPPLRRWNAALALAAFVATAGALPLIPRVIPRFGTLPPPLAAVLLITLVSVVATLVRYRLLRRELQEEVSLGFLEPADAAAVTHPLKRFGSGSWQDRQARRAFVRVANEIARKKRRQRGMDAATARLYQIEILKLRMELQAIQQVEVAVRSANSDQGARVPQ